MPTSFTEAFNTMIGCRIRELEVLKRLPLYLPYTLPPLLDDRYHVSLHCYAHDSADVHIDVRMSTTLKPAETFLAVMPILECIADTVPSTWQGAIGGWTTTNLSALPGRQYTFKCIPSQSVHLTFTVNAFVPEKGTENCKVQVVETERTRTDVTYSLVCTDAPAVPASE